jgi:hypothetical protein
MKELAAPNQNFTPSAVNDRDFIETVPGPDYQLLHILHAVNLHAIRPWAPRPIVEDRSGQDGILLLVDAQISSLAAGPYELDCRNVTERKSSVRRTRAQRDSEAAHHQNKSFSGMESGAEGLNTAWRKRG